MHVAGSAPHRVPGAVRIRDLADHHPRVVDAAIALGLLAMTLHWAIAHQRLPPLPEFTLAAAGTLPQAVRRRAPTTVCAIVLAIALAAAAASATEIARALGISLMLALYSVAAHESTTRLIVCALGYEAWATAAAATSPSVLLVAVLLTGCGAGAAMTGLEIRNRRTWLRARAEHAARAEHERRRLAAATERMRIAREVHDIVAHNLSAMVGLCDAAAATLESSPSEAVEAVRAAAETGREAMLEMRQLLHTLREGSTVQLAPQPQIAELHTLVEHTRRAGIATRLTVSGAPPDPLPAGVQLAVYRIVQESLTNVRRHAISATAAEVRLRFDNLGIELEIEDDGRAAAQAPRGHGIVGMRERAAACGARLEAAPRPDGGWRVYVRLGLADTEPR